MTPMVQTLFVMNKANLAGLEDRGRDYILTRPLLFFKLLARHPINICVRRCCMYKRRAKNSKKPNAWVTITFHDKYVNLEVNIPSRWLIILISTLTTVLGYPKIIELFLKLLDYK